MSTLNFAWVAEDAAFDPEVHAVQDEAIRSLEIEERENRVPVCRIVVEAPAAGLLSDGRLQHAFVSESVGDQTRLLFHGRLIAVPADLSGPFATLAFEPAAGDLAAAVAAAVEPLAVAPYWDPLFVRDSDEDDPEAMLAAYHARPWIDRTSGAVAVSDSLTGRGVSATSVAVGTGEKQLVVPAGFGWRVGTRLRAARRADLCTFMEGAVSAYAGTLLTLAVDTTGGGGTHGDWLISVAFAAADIEGDSVDVTCSGLPLPEVAVSVTAEWVQAAQGVVDVGQVLRNGLGGPLRTLSADFVRRWPRPGAPVGAHSGYRVVESALDPLPAEIDLLARDADGSLIHFSPPIRVLTAARERLRIFGYRPHLTVAYDYAQKRREVLRFTLAGNAQALAGEEAAALDLDFVLRDVGEEPTPAWVPSRPYETGALVNVAGTIYEAIAASADAVFDPAKWAPTAGRSAIGDRRRSSFFLTDRGGIAIDHAIEVAAARLAESQRAVTVSWRVHGWPAVLTDLSCDHSATVESPRLPGGRATGKVVALRLFRDGDTGALGGEVTIACSVGLGYQGAAAESVNAYVETDYVQDGLLAGTGNRESGGRGITYAAYADQQPQQGLTTLVAMRDDDWIATAAFSNLYPEQLAFLQAHEWYGASWGEDGTANMAGGHFQLGLVPTDLDLTMIDITGSDALVHEIVLTPTHPYGRFPTIDLT